MTGPSVRVRPLPVALLVLTCAVAVASVPPSAGLEPVVDTALYPLNAVALGGAGLLIRLRVPRHRVGLLLAGLGLAAALVELLEGYGYHDTWPAALTAQWAASWGSLVGAGSTATVLALFPNGRAAGRRWRWLPAFTVGATATAVLGAALSHANDDSYTFTRGGNPYALDGLDVLYTIGELAFAASLVLSVVSLVDRFRRAGGAERQQFKLIFWFACVLVVVGPAAAVDYNRSVVVQVAIALLVPLLPITICVAILRYRLYDVDVLIARTIVYAALTVLLAVAWGATALVLGALLGGGSAWVTAGATIAATAAVLPLRRRVQDGVDRAFRRARHHALARVEAYLEDLRAGRASADELEGLLRDVLCDPALELRLLLPGESPTPAVAGAGADGCVRTLVERSGVALAEVTHAVPAGEPLSDVLSRAGLAIEIARLQAEVRRRLAEVEASRARIVATTHEERRRLGRDLHDGAQQRLVSAGLALRHVQHQLGEQPAARDIEVVVTEIGGAIQDLRELAHGVRPARLDDGLELALRELAGRAPLPVQVQAALDPLPDAVVAAAYYVAAEALTNVVKHAVASTVELRASREDGELVLIVQDDGVGGAEPGGGSGLRGLADRVAALGGRLRLESPAGAGTTLTIRLPCAS
ncbi:sensor histidine kinase [Frankia tisae]|uniref:sensor histidine kinase n=1 Tax=Frankia tisae TaxID=2950104 RepID=UPI0021C0BFF8|nr:histidine kinase [Frankia tisae]